jgi:hypothetical protein
MVFVSSEVLTWQSWKKKPSFSKQFQHFLWWMKTVLTFSYLQIMFETVSEFKALENFDVLKLRVNQALSLYESNKKDIEVAELNIMKQMEYEHNNELADYFLAYLVDLSCRICPCNIEVVVVKRNLDKLCWAAENIDSKIDPSKKIVTL